MSVGTGVGLAVGTGVGLDVGAGVGFCVGTGVGWAVTPQKPIVLHTLAGPPHSRMGVVTLSSWQVKSVTPSVHALVFV